MRLGTRRTIMDIRVFPSASSPVLMSSSSSASSLFLISRRMSGSTAVRLPRLLLMLAFLFAACSAESVTPATHEELRERINSPMPYGFKYEAVGDDGGGHTREESADGSGRVVGSYTIFTADGLERRVYYEADENGFRAHIETNEPGTKTSNPADVTIVSSAGDYQPNAATVRPSKPVPGTKGPQSPTETTTGIPQETVFPSRYESGGSGGPRGPGGSEQITSRILRVNRPGEPYRQPGFASEGVARSPFLRVQPGSPPTGIVPIGPIQVSRIPVRPQQRPDGRPRPQINYGPSITEPFGFQTGGGRPMHPSYDGSFRVPASSSGGIFSPAQVAAVNPQSLEPPAGFENAPGSALRSQQVPGGFSPRFGEQQPGSLAPERAGGQQPGLGHLPGPGGPREQALHRGLDKTGLGDEGLDGLRASIAARGPSRDGQGGVRGPGAASRGSPGSRVGSPLDEPRAPSAGPAGDQDSDNGADDDDDFPPNDPRRPYLFKYEAAGPGSLSSRTEEADVSGRVKGSYTIRTPDGKTRSVDYEADHRGFKAKIHTNEFGTQSHDPANVTFVSSARGHSPFGDPLKPFKPRPLEVGHPEPILIASPIPGSPDSNFDPTDPQDLNAFNSPSQFGNFEDSGPHDHTTQDYQFPSGKPMKPNQRFPGQAPRRNQDGSSGAVSPFQRGQGFQGRQGRPGGVDSGPFTGRGFQQNLPSRQLGGNFPQGPQDVGAPPGSITNPEDPRNKQIPQFVQKYIAPVPVMSTIGNIPNPRNHAANRMLNQFDRDNFGPQNTRFDQPSLVSIDMVNHGPQNLPPPRRFQQPSFPNAPSQSVDFPQSQLGSSRGSPVPVPFVKLPFGRRFGDRPLQAGPPVHQVLYSDTPQELGGRGEPNRPGNLGAGLRGGFEGLIRQDQADLLNETPKEKGIPSGVARHGGGLEFLEELLPYYEKELGLDGKGKDKVQPVDGERKPVEHIPIVPSKHELLCDDNDDPKSHDSKLDGKSKNGKKCSLGGKPGDSRKSDGRGGPGEEVKEPPVGSEEEFLNYRNPFSGVLVSPDRDTPEKVDRDGNNLQPPFVSKDGLRVPVLLGGGKPPPDGPPTVLIDGAPVPPVSVDDNVDGNVSPNFGSGPALGIPEKGRAVPPGNQGFQQNSAPQITGRDNNNRQTGLRRDPLDFFQKFGVPSRDISNPPSPFLQPIRSGSAFPDQQNREPQNPDSQGAPRNQLGSALGAFGRSAFPGPFQRPVPFGQRLSGLKNTGDSRPPAQPVIPAQVQPPYRRNGQGIFPPPPLHRGPVLQQGGPGFLAGGRNDNQAPPSVQLIDPSHTGQDSPLGHVRPDVHQNQDTNFQKPQLHHTGAPGGDPNLQNNKRLDDPTHGGGRPGAPLSFSFVNTRPRRPGPKQVTGKQVPDVDFQGRPKPQFSGNRAPPNNQAAPLILGPTPDVSGPLTGRGPAGHFTFVDTRRPNAQPGQPRLQGDRRKSFPNQLTAPGPVHEADRQDQPGPQDNLPKQPLAPGSLLRKPLLENNNQNPGVLVKDNAPSVIHGPFSFVDTRRPRLPQDGRQQGPRRVPLSVLNGINQAAPGQVAGAPRRGQGASRFGQGAARLGQGAPRLGQVAPELAQGVPGLGQVNPALEQVNPALGLVNPGLVNIGPVLGQVSPGLRQVNPGLGQAGPGLVQATPGLGQVGPGLVQVGPGLGQTSPELGQVDPGLGQGERGSQDGPVSFTGGFGVPPALGFPDRLPQYPQTGVQDDGNLGNKQVAGGRDGLFGQGLPQDNQHQPGGAQLPTADQQPGEGGASVPGTPNTFGPNPQAVFRGQPLAPVVVPGGPFQPGAPRNQQQGTSFGRDSEAQLGGRDDAGTPDLRGPGFGQNFGFNGRPPSVFGGPRRLDSRRRPGFSLTQRNDGRPAQGILPGVGNVGPDLTSQQLPQAPQDRAAQAGVDGSYEGGPPSVGPTRTPLAISQRVGNTPVTGRNGLPAGGRFRGTPGPRFDAGRDQAPLVPNLNNQDLGQRKDQQLAREGFGAPEDIDDVQPRNYDQRGRDENGNTGAYSFGYVNDDQQGSRVMQQEERDDDGRVTGFYIVEDVDGRKRTVHYIADKDGFRARVHTNEQGTENLDPADVKMRVENRMPHPPPRKPPKAVAAEEVPADGADQNVKS
ncbi:collagen alpha-5(IV) chain [Ixodes scapularis]